MGHHWVETHAMGQSPDVRWHFLTPTHGTGGGAFRAVRYQPLAAYSGLFRNFAATDPSLAAIKSFAGIPALSGSDQRTERLSSWGVLAEGVGFEPTVPR
jgi:hypothetical protein